MADSESIGEAIDYLQGGTVMTLMQFLLKLRYLVIVAMVFSILNGIALLGLGVYKSIKSYQALLAPWESGEGPGIMLVESVDVFLAALVLIILGIGLAVLFLIRDEGKDSLQIPSWMKVKSFLELKLILWEAVLTVLVVAFLGHAAVQAEDLHWKILILPASILMLAVSLFIMKKISGGHG